MIKKFITSFTLLSYLIISLLSSGQDVLCVHNSGLSNFESIVNSECVRLDFSNHKTNDKLSFSVLDIDDCYDLVILKDLRNQDSKIFSLSLVSTPIIVTDYIKYLANNTLSSNHQIYLTKIDQKDIIEESNTNHISTSY